MSSVSESGSSTGGPRAPVATRHAMRLLRTHGCRLPRCATLGVAALVACALGAQIGAVFTPVVTFHHGGAPSRPHLGRISG